MPAGSDQAYKARLGQVLRQRDPAALHLFLRQRAADYGDEQQVADLERRSHAEMEALMHRMIIARPDLVDLHPASEAWLADDSPRPTGRAGPRRPNDRPRSV